MAYKPKVRKRRIYWTGTVSEDVVAHNVYLHTDPTMMDDVNFNFGDTPGIEWMRVEGKMELIIPDEWPDFPFLDYDGDLFIGVTAVDELGNESVPLMFSANFDFAAPSAPLTGGVETV